MASSFHVRLKPYNGKSHVVRSYTAFGIRFLENRGWYKVDRDVGEYLRTVKQRETDEHSAPAFDVCTEAEAKDIDEREAEKVLRARADVPHTDAVKRVHNVTREGAQRHVARPEGVLTSGHLPTATPEPSGEFTDDMADDATPVAPPPKPAPARVAPKATRPSARAARP